MEGIYKTTQSKDVVFRRRKEDGRGLGMSRRFTYLEPKI